MHTICKLFHTTTYCHEDFSLGQIAVAVGGEGGSRATVLNEHKKTRLSEMIVIIEVGMRLFQIEKRLLIRVVSTF